MRNIFEDWLDGAILEPSSFKNLTDYITCLVCSRLGITRLPYPGQKGLDGMLVGCEGLTSWLTRVEFDVSTPPTNSREVMSEIIDALCDEVKRLNPDKVYAIEPLRINTHTIGFKLRAVGIK